MTEDRFFCSHRLPLARAAQRSGYEVVVVARILKDGDRIRQEGFRLVHWQLIRESYSPIKEIRAIHQLRRIYRQEQPDIVHHIALKPVLYGSLAALGHEDTKVLNALTGLGYLASSLSMKARLLRLAIWDALKFVLNRTRNRVLLQNQDDKQLLMEELGVSPEKITIIRGSGVDVDLFHPTPEPQGVPVVLLASRMLWIKGVEEFFQAARLLKDKGVSARFILVGDTDDGAPSAVPVQQLVEWQRSGFVEWMGHQTEMAALFQQGNLVCLPSQGGEGVPKVLLEAAASGRAIVTTDVPGCRDIVRDGINGLVVPPRNPAALSAAIEELLTNQARRMEMARRGREIAVSEFSQEAVVDQTLALYRELLRPVAVPGPHAANEL